MLIVISPAKRLDWDARDVAMTEPEFLEDANRLAKTMRNLTLGDLRGLMDLSDDPARLNRDRFRAFYGEDPIPFSSNQYDAVALLALAIARAGSTDGVAIRDALLEVSGPPSDTGGLVEPGALAAGLADVRRGTDVDYQGASGNVNFDALGNVVTAYEIWRYDAPGSTASCDDRTTLSGDRGSFCRFRTLNAEEIR